MTDELKGHIYDLADPQRQSDQYTKTTKEIAVYVGKAYRYGGDASHAVETLQAPVIPIPPDPADDRRI